MSILTNDTNQENEISTVKILHFDVEEITDMIFGLLFNIFLLFSITLLFCICK